VLAAGPADSDTLLEVGLGIVGHALNGPSFCSLEILIFSLADSINLSSRLEPICLGLGRQHGRHVHNFFLTSASSLELATSQLLPLLLSLKSYVCCDQAPPEARTEH